MSTDQHHRRLDRIEQATGAGDGMPLVMVGPVWAQKDGADPPPDELDDPIWSEQTGWIESDPGAGYVVALYAPDGVDEGRDDGSDADTP